MKSAAKVLKFPLSGIVKDLDYRKAYIPDENATFATPFAVNVRGTDSFRRRNRGGSRPGLKRISVPSGTRTNDPHEHPIVSGISSVIPSTTCRYRGRHAMANGSAWYMSALGETTNWTFNGDAEDPSRAFSGNVELAGREGEPITALIPVRDDWLFIATRHSMWCLTGDPVGGTIKCVSEHVGCVSADAWCFDGTNVWTVSNNGLYAFQIGEIPVKVSGVIPEEFDGLDEALCLYDSDENAIHVFASKSSVAQDWYYDIANKAFWKMSFPTLQRPTRGFYIVNGGVEKIAFVGTDGFTRVFDDVQTTDDGTAIQSRVAIGPVRAGIRDDIDGFVAEVSATVAEGSSPATMSVYTAHSPEKAVSDAEIGTADHYTASVSQGWNCVVRPRKRGAWAVFVVSSSGRWGYESMTMIGKSLGRLR